MSDEPKPEAPAEKSPVEAHIEANKDWLDKFGDAHKMLGQIYSILKNFGPEYTKTVSEHEDRADARQEVWNEKAEAAAEERNLEQCAAMIFQGLVITRHESKSTSAKSDVVRAVELARQLRAELIRTRPVKPEGDEEAP